MKAPHPEGFKPYYTNIIDVNMSNRRKMSNSRYNETVTIFQITVDVDAINIQAIFFANAVIVNGDNEIYIYS